MVVNMRNEDHKNYSSHMANILLAIGFILLFFVVICVLVIAICTGNILIQLFSIGLFLIGIAIAID